jgi:hypothetical protein
LVPSLIEAKINPLESCFLNSDFKEFLEIMYQKNMTLQKKKIHKTGEEISSMGKSQLRKQMIASDL